MLAVGGGGYPLMNVLYRTYSQLIDALFSWSDNPVTDKTFGCLIVLTPQGTFVQDRVGPLRPEEFRPDKYDQLEILSLEKAKRLRRHPKHFSSFQSRNPEKNQLGGAVRIENNNFILSLTYVNEELDEAIVTATAWHMGIMSMDETRRIAEASGNQFISRLMEIEIESPF